MTKLDNRLKNFKSGIKKLSKKSRNYIHKITHYLFYADKIPIYLAEGEKEKTPV